MSNALGALPGKLHYPASSMGSPVRSGSGEPPGEEIDPQSPGLSCRQALAFAVPSARNTSALPPPPTQMGVTCPCCVLTTPGLFPL